MSRFQTTHWSLVLAAAHDNTREGREALTSLCEAYWYPLYAFIRRQGYDEDAARDLIQAYFLRLFEKNYLRDVKPQSGRFRSFLLVSLKHFLSDERDKARAGKRNPGRAPISLDVATAEKRYATALVDEMTPERAFEKRWAMTVLERVLSRLREQSSQAGKSQQFERLKGYLIGEEPASPYREAAAELGTSEGAVKVSVHRLRRRFGEILREEIAETVAGPDQIEDELRHLLTELD